MNKTVLVVEDDDTLAHNICAYLIRHGWDVQRCASAEQALESVKAIRPDVVTADCSLPRMNGIEMLQEMLAADPQVKVVMLTGDDSAQTAVRAMKAGAYDYLTKPVSMAELLLLLERAVGTRQMEQALHFHQQRQAQGAGVQALVGESAAMQELKAKITQILDAERSMRDGELPAILIHGETGTGKELVARSLHVDGVRSNSPFVEVNCASIPSHLLEAELFGHEKGAFTDAKERKIGLVESADNGTLFLDEIGEIDHALQAKLLKLLEEKTIRRVGSVKERKINLRIISATNRNLEQMVREGKFRSDLFFRLRIISINVPPLRARGNDIQLLARHFLAAHGRRYGKHGLRFSEEAEALLMRYTWPGNVREMRNMLEQTVLLSRSSVIEANQLAFCANLTEEKAPDTGTAPEFCQSLPTRSLALAEAERDTVVKTLERTGWNVTKAARLLGVSRDVMRYRIEKLRLERPSL